MTPEQSSRGSSSRSSGGGASGGAPAVPMRLGDYLVARGHITPEQLDNALEQQRVDGMLLGQVLLKLGYLEEEDLAETLAGIAGIPYVEIEPEDVDPGAADSVPKEVAHRHTVIPLRVRDDTLLVAFADPFDVLAVDEIERRTGFTVKQVGAPESQVRRAIESRYGRSSNLEGIVSQTIESLEQEEQRAAESGSVVFSMAEAEEAGPVIRLADELIQQGVEMHATDLHVEPEDKGVRVRYRIDGMLQAGPMLPKRVQNALISRLKVIAGMDIAEQRVPQEGRISWGPKGQVDLRVSSFPTVFGEKVAVRILERERLFTGLEDLGLEGTTLENFRDAAEHTKGILLVTGPTGAGKSTTLYAMLQSQDTLRNNIVTLEDPVEYRIPQIRQSQINVKAGFTFAAGLRSSMRQDPDIIMVGEIRDPETAGLAVRAALTGILVYSTLHTNEAAGTFARLMDMGLESYLIASTLIATVAQRLVRKVCRHCAEPTEPDDELLGKLDLGDEPREGEWLRGVGCSRCYDTGYSGRTGIFEILMVDDDIRGLIQQKADARTIQRAAREAGMETLLQHGLRLVRRGETTLEELARVARE